MDSFWSAHWWAIPLWLAGVALLIAAVMQARRNPEATTSRVIFILFPGLDPTREHPAASRRTMWIAFLVLFVLLGMEILR